METAVVFVTGLCSEPNFSSSGHLMDTWAL